MTQTITGLFGSYANATTAIDDLEAAGIPHHDISIVANGPASRISERVDRAGEDAGKGAGIGAAVGGVGGLLASIGLLAIPGLGPVVAAGWFASTVVGAVGGAIVGGAAAGLVGALTRAGVSEEDAHVYAVRVRQGGALVSAKVDEAYAPLAQAILNGAPTDIARRRALLMHPPLRA